MKGEIIKKIARPNGTGAVIYVPRKWLGHRVKAEDLGRPPANAIDISDLPLKDMPTYKERGKNG